MKKEIVVAIVFGVVLGLIVAVIMIIKLRQLEGKKNGPFSNEAQISPEVKNTAQIQQLVITQPSDGTIVGQNSVTIKGKASKNSLIVVESAIKDQAFKNDKGDFSIDFPLARGENVIDIAVYPQNSQLSSQKKTVKVYWLKE